MASCYSFRAAAATLPALALVLATGAAHGQSTPSATELATRRSLIEQAQQARTQNQHERALDLAQRASFIQQSPSLRLFIAQEEQAVGRYAEAFGDADLCMRDAANDRTARNAAQVEGECRALAAQLRPRIGNVVVNVAPDEVRRASGLRLLIAGHEVAPSLLGAPYVVSPGRVRVEVSANGFRAASAEVDVAATRTETVNLTLEAAPPDPGADPPPNNGNTTIVNPPPQQVLIIQNPPQQLEPTGPGPGPWVLVGIGGAGLVASGVFYALSHVARGECPVSPEDNQGVCPSQTEFDRVVTWEVAATVSAGVGGALVLSGILWRVLAGNSRPASPTITVTQRPAARLTPSFDPLAGRAGLTVHW